MPDPHRELTEGKVAALKLLKAAYDDAEDTGEEPWQFAINKDELMAAGASSSDLLWLLTRRYVAHVREVTRNGEPRRQFQATGDFALTPNSCFHITYGGNTYVEGNGFHHRPNSKPTSDAAAKRDARRRDGGNRKRTLARQPEEPGAANAEVPPPRERETPTWNAAEGDLYWRGRVILHLAPHASAERAILDQFKLWGWESPIPNPIPRSEVGDHTQARRSAVYNLNHHFRKNTPITIFCLQGDLMGWRAHSESRKHS